MLIGLFLFELLIFGLFLTYFFKLKLFFEERLAIGLLIGFIVMGYSVLYLSYLIGLNKNTLLIFISFTVLITVFLTKGNIKNIKIEVKELIHRLKEKSWMVFFILVLLSISFFGFQISKLMTFESGRFYSQPLHAWGDISQHLEIISGFAYGDNFPPQNHSLSGTKISYPFMFDFITSIFINPFGLNFDQAVKLTGVIMISLLVIILSYFVFRFTKSKISALLVLPLFFFNGGFGFIHFFNDLQTNSKSFLEFITRLEKDYTALKDIGYQWINVMLSMIIPQRSFLMGLPVSLVILRFVMDLSEEFEYKRFLISVLIFSLLPAIHTYSFIGLVPFLFYFGLSILIKNLNHAKSIIITSLIGIFISASLAYSFLEQGSNPTNLFSINYWWMANEENPLTFYIKNFGVILAALPLFLILGIRNRTKLFYLGLIGLVWLILPSIFSFTPWEFDNIKLIIYWYLAAVIFISFPLGNWLKSGSLFKSLIAAVFIFHFVFSGALDNLRLFTSSGTKYETYSPQAILVGNFVRENIKKDAVFLSVDKFDNPALTLGGRSVVLGFRGWLWSHGINYSQRETDVKSMLTGQDMGLFKKYNVSHIILFENEQNNYLINEEYFRQFKLIYNQDGYKIYQI